MARPKEKSSSSGDLRGLAELQRDILRLQELAAKGNLVAAELFERDNLLRYLRKRGVSSKEISELLDGQLKEDTIRKITVKVKVDESGVKDRLAALMLRMLQADIDISDIVTMISLQEELNRQGIPITNITSLLEEANEAKYPPAEIIAKYREQTEVGLSFSELSQDLKFQKDMKAMGFTNEMLKKLSEIAHKNNRDPEKVLQTVAGFENLESSQVTLEKIQKDIGQANKQLEKTKMNNHKAEIENAHFQTWIEMVQSLVNDHHFSLAAIKDIHGAAKKQGDPSEVLVAIEAYGSLKNIRYKIKEALIELNRLTAKTTEAETLLAAIRAKAKIIVESTTDQVQQVLGKITEAYENSIHSMSDKLSEIIKKAAESGRIQGQTIQAAEILGPQIRMIKIIEKATISEEEAKTIPMEYVLALLRAVQNILIAKKDKSTISTSTGLLISSGEIYKTEYETVRYVHAAIIALEDARAAAASAA